MTATSAAALPASSEAAAAPRRLAAPLWVGALLLILAFLVIYPLLMLVFGALSDSNPVVDGFGNFKPSVKHFLDVLGNENVHLAFFNALVACGGGTIAGGGDRARLLVDRRAHQHARSRASSPAPA